MLKIDKVHFSTDSGFDLKRAMELANLIEVAYDEYEIWDRHQEKLPPDTIVGSTAFAALSLKEQTESYERLYSVWEKHPTNRKQYKRLEKFWYTEWWWLELKDFRAFFNFSNPISLLNLLKSNTNLQALLNRIKLFTVETFKENLNNSFREDQLFGFIAQSEENPKDIFVVFRGTREPSEWINNITPKPQQFLNNQELGEVRNGFNQIYTKKQGDHETIEKTIINFFNTHSDVLNGANIFITGHSLGAALANLAALHIAELAKEKDIKPSIYLYTFASPRVGNEDFAKHFNQEPLQNSYRIINSEDIIQSVPLPTTQLIDEATLEAMDDEREAQARLRLLWIRAFLEWITNGQAGKHFQHIGIPITFTKQTGTIAGNHNLTKTYREALNI